MPEMEVTYNKTYHRDGELFGSALITCSCGWVKSVKDSIEDFEAHISAEIEDHTCLGTTTKKDNS